VAVVRSPHAHARILAIHGEAARRAPGVRGVFTAADLGAANAPMPTYAPHPGLPIVCGTRPLAADRVRFVGEPVAVVVATDPYRAHDALDLVRVDYEPLPAVTNVEAALAPGAPIVHEALRGNVAAEWSQRVGDADAALRSAPVVARTRLRLTRGGAHPLEPRGLVARWADGQLTLWAAVQMVHRHRSVYAPQLGLAEEQIRVIAPLMSGAGSGPRGCTTPNMSSWPRWP
jgi:aerobic carbon-monoxide dehydrogenase large subunit